jgi:hypothetical protein
VLVISRGHEYDDGPCLAHSYQCETGVSLTPHTPSHQGVRPPAVALTRRLRRIGYSLVGAAQVSQLNPLL